MCDSITTNHLDQSCKRPPGCQIAILPTGIKKAECWTSDGCRGNERRKPETARVSSHPCRKDSHANGLFLKREGAPYNPLSMGIGQLDTNRALQIPWCLLLCKLKKKPSFRQRLAPCLSQKVSTVWPHSEWGLRGKQSWAVSYGALITSPNQFHFEDAHTAKAHQHISARSTDYGIFSPRVCHKTLVSETSADLCENKIMGKIGRVVTYMHYHMLDR